jgi:hypothetical protein
MDNYESTSNYHTYENQSASKYVARERGGLVPVTANIISKAEIGQDDQVEYQGVPIIDITAVGYVVDYKENDNKVKITLYDYTGLLEVNFFVRQESNESIGLDKFEYTGKREPVQIFGTVKVFKGHKVIQGKIKVIKDRRSYTTTVISPEVSER